MFEKLALLKKKGYFPTVIIDIGAYHGVWTQHMKLLYPDSKYILFEAIDYDELKKYTVKENLENYNVVLSDCEKTVDWYEMRNTGDSMYKEKTKYFNNCKVLKKKTTTLNNVLTNIDKNKIFIKIDCQGAEIEILKGATEILKKTEFILLEIPLFGQYNEGVPTFLEHIKYLDSIGFVPYDIVDNHYINDFNMQIDMLFINKNHIFNILVNKQIL